MAFTFEKRFLSFRKSGERATQPATERLTNEPTVVDVCFRKMSVSRSVTPTAAKRKTAYFQFDSSARTVYNVR